MTIGPVLNWPRVGGQWVQYDWSQPISTKQVEVYWWDDRQGVRLPSGCRVKYWDGMQFVPVANPSGLGVAGDTFNVTTFDEVTTTKLRLETDSTEQFSTGVLEWRVLDSGKSPPSSVTSVGQPSGECAEATPRAEWNHELKNNRDCQKQL